MVSEFSPNFLRTVSERFPNDFRMVSEQNGEFGGGILTEVVFYLNFLNYKYFKKNVFKKS